MASSVTIAPADSPSRSRQLLGPVGVGLLGTGAAVCLALVSPHEPGSYLACPLFALTGLYCAGCGTLRAVHELTHLDIVGAWGMNPLLVVALPFLVLWWFAWVRRAWAGETRRAPAPVWFVWAAFGVIVGYSVLRNVPALAPWLAP